MESSTVEQEKELAATKADARITEARTMPPARSSSRKFAIFGALLVLAAIGAYLWVHSLNRVSTDDAQVDGHIIPISPKIYGKVLEVLIDDNQEVKKGQVLVRIDPRDYQAKVDQEQAALEVAESQARTAGVNVPLTRGTTASGTSSADAQLSGAEAQFEQAKLDYEKASTNDIAFARSNVNTAQATADRAKADLERMHPLVDKAEISKIQYDSYVAAARVADSELEAARNKLAAA